MTPSEDSLERAEFWALWESDRPAAVRRLLGSAEESISVLFLADSPLMDLLDQTDWIRLAEKGVRIRCMVGLPPGRTDAGGILAGLKGAYEARMSSQGKMPWEMRFLALTPTLFFLIVDHKALLFSRPVVASNLWDRSVAVSFIELWTYLFENDFDMVWDQADQSQILHEDVFDSSMPEIAGPIVVASKERWDEVLRHFMEHPEELRRVDSRYFEEFVAELLERDGMRVTLTQASRDRGRDILAWADTTAGEHLYLVECKRYAPERPVGVQMVRALYGVVEQEQATGGILVTTSRFTRGAQEFQKTIQHRLWLKDYPALLTWLRKG